MRFLNHLTHRRNKSLLFQQCRSFVWKCKGSMIKSEHHLIFMGLYTAERQHQATLWWRMGLRGIKKAAEPHCTCLRGKCGALGADSSCLQPRCVSLSHCALLAPSSAEEALQHTQAVHHHHSPRIVYACVYCVYACVCLVSESLRCHKLPSNKQTHCSNNSANSSPPAVPK